MRIALGFLALSPLLALAAVDQGRRDELASVRCERHVRKALKAPESADFGAGGAVSDLGGGKGVVRGVVMAQNDFGAKVRQKYSCSMKKLPNGDWSIYAVNL